MVKPFEGILPVYKPAGFTSHDVVAKMRRILKMKRIGHTGTLDPQVTGVLPLCLGRATRVVEYMQELPKEYLATLRLGLATDTEDLTGEVIERSESPVEVTQDQVEEVLQKFLGTISQVPPMYSAVKVDGKRLYELAREGKTVERKSREVTIYELELIGIETHDGTTDISFRALCSKGTYIRTLCVDIGRELGFPSTMVKLERTISAGISADHCLRIEDVEQRMNEGTLSEALIPVDEAISSIPAHKVGEEQTKGALQGQKLSARLLEPPVEKPGLLRLYAQDGTFLGIFERDESKPTVRAVKVFLPE
ncbi:MULTISPECIES: tRNA pseudouridine(55) synthase TruB [Paenibacillus]|uniref:tRNA pseudouridine synthase B n=1 Tax=Paenibacillus cucumis (ex Kampfer et al. 2016) TaxID=1776858 RepID=A0ABS7KPJ3_9BACL|nr:MULTISPECIES: tRNA pseudouridine(55) synthase TruB [Paenibacillus]MBY0206088.1 tRNA pseudouridine(55) synthase TruB [Paenibacillus cucumis (ex Kampfer et al. 2016)]MDP9698447.1 tRNA pseudouridine55 synthase [Paenibacillus intestini]